MPIAASLRLSALWTRSTVLGRVGLVAAGLSIVSCVPVVLIVSSMYANLVWNIIAPAPDPLPGLDGPENDSILRGIPGVVLHQVGHELESISISDRNPRAVQHDRAWFVSGPDNRGRYAFVTEKNGYLQDRHALHVASLADDSDRVVFERPGSTNWHGTIRLVEIAPTGGLLAVVTKPYDPIDPFDPSGPVTLELWNLDDSGHRELPAEGVYSGSWFPDGRRIAIEAWIDPDSAGSVEPMPDVVRKRRGLAPHLDRRPAIFVLDTTTDERTWVTWGEQPRVSPDGGRMMMRLGSEACVIFDLASRSSSPVSLPGAIEYPCAWMSRDVLLYPAAPTTGADPGYARAPVFRPTPKWTLKAARPGTSEFVTVVPSVGPFERYSFGVFDEPR